MDRYAKIFIKIVFWIDSRWDYFSLKSCLLNIAHEGWLSLILNNIFLSHAIYSFLFIPFIFPVMATRNIWLFIWWKFCPYYYYCITYQFVPEAAVHFSITFERNWAYALAYRSQKVLIVTNFFFYQISINQRRNFETISEKKDTSKNSITFERN